MKSRITIIYILIFIITFLFLLLCNYLNNILFYIALILIIINIFMYILSVYFYNLFFNIRYNTDSKIKFNLEDFPNLKRDEYSFKSNNNQILTGYNYYYNKNNIKGIVILAHGFGAGSNIYMDCANYFAKNNYYAFLFDVTGTDESEGKSINGLPQGVIDLDYAISFVEKEFKGLPIFLFGHSWGAYCATSVLKFHPEVKAVVSLSAFNRSLDLLKANSTKKLGILALIGINYIKIYELIKFGKYANLTSLSSLEDYKSKVMIIQSKDDIMVPEKYGYDIFYNKYKDNPRFKFINLLDRGHIKVYYNNDSNLNKNYDNYFFNKQLSFKKEENSKLPDNIYKSTNSLDEELFREIIEFYNI